MRAKLSLSVAISVLLGLVFATSLRAQERPPCPRVPSTATAEEQAVCWFDLGATVSWARNAAAWCADVALDDARVANACLLSHVRAGELEAARSIAEYVSRPDALAARCRERLTGVTTLRLVTTPPGGEVFVAGASRGRAPVELRLPSPWWTGHIEVAFGDDRRQVSNEQLRAALDVNSCELTDVLVSGPSPQTSGPDGLDTRLRLSEEPARDDHTTTRILAWTSLGAAVVAAGTAVIAWRVREQHANEWNNDASCLVPGGGTREEQCADARDAADTAQTISTIGLVGAGLFGLGSALLFVLAGTDDREEVGGAGLTCGGGPGDVGLSCIGVF